MSSGPATISPSLYSLLGFKDKNSNGIIQKRSWRTLFRDEGYKPEADLNGDGQIDMIEAKYYLQSLPNVDLKIKSQFRLTREERQSALMLRIAKARKVQALTEKYYALLSLADDMQALGFELSKIATIYEEAADAIRNGPNSYSDNAMMISNVAVAMAKHGQPRFRIITMFKYAYSAIIDGLDSYFSWSADKEDLNNCKKSSRSITNTMFSVGLSPNEVQFVKSDLMAFVESQKNRNKDDDYNPQTPPVFDVKSERFNAMRFSLGQLSRIDTSEDITSMVVEIFQILRQDKPTKEQQKQLIHDMFGAVKAIAKAVVKVAAVNAVLYEASGSEINMEEKKAIFARGEEILEDIREPGIRLEGYLNEAISMSRAGMDKRSIRDTISKCEDIALSNTYEIDTAFAECRIGATMISAGFSKKEAKEKYVLALRSAKAKSEASNDQNATNAQIALIMGSLASNGYTSQEIEDILKEAGVALPE